ncbi:hypothetical protein FKM82_007267 [Ascaphus truei]
MVQQSPVCKRQRMFRTSQMQISTHLYISMLVPKDQASIYHAGIHSVSFYINVTSENISSVLFSNKAILQYTGLNRATINIPWRYNSTILLHICGLTLKHNRHIG